MLFNNQGQVKLTLQEQIACRTATTLQQHIDKNDTTIGAKAGEILRKRVAILKPLREKLWPSNEKPDAFFRLGARARLV
jgi:hypothetical protein